MASITTAGRVPRSQKRAPAEDRPLGHLRRYRVERLFQRRNYTIQLAQDGPTIITGANGTGKSTILRSIDAIAAARWGELYNLPFARLRLDFDSGATISASRQDGSLRIELEGKSWTYKPEEFASTKAWNFNVSSALVAEYLANAYESSEHVVPNIRHSDWLLAPTTARDQKWLSDIPNRFPVSFITDQRLLLEQTDDKVQRRVSGSPTPGSPRARRVVDEFARDLAQRVSAAFSEYYRQSQALERDVARRMVRAMSSGEQVSVTELERLLTEVETNRQRLERVGLVFGEVAPVSLQELSSSDPKVRPAIRSVVLDAKAKLDTLAPLLDRVEVFTRFLNQHYVSKRVRVDAEKGFAIEILEEPGGMLEPSQLSSGEQQLLVLAYEILFRAQPGTLMLIDEPELSLHVLWQDTIVDDLARMGAFQDLRFLVASHSPTLIGGREHLRRSLDRG